MTRSFARAPLALRLAVTSVLVLAVTSVLAVRSSTSYGADIARLVASRVTIIGDSVTMDARANLIADIRGAVVHAKLSEQWDQGVTYLRHLKAAGRLGSVVVVALGTNGPISRTGMAQMMRTLAPCTRVVLVTNHVPDFWQNPNNRLMKAAAATHRNVVVADWQALAAAHPGWFYSDGVHMLTGGAGARAYARLIASKVPARFRLRT